MKWSNGDDLTTDDWMFWYTDILTNTDVNPSVEAAYCSNGKPMVYEQIDPYTLDIVLRSRIRHLKSRWPVMPQI